MNAIVSTTGQVIRYIVLFVWAAAVIGAIAAYVSNPSRFTAGSIAEFIISFHSEIWLVFLTVSILRGFTLLPSTPLVLAGAFLYPDEPWLVLLISVTGILVSSSLIYFFSEALGFAAYFEKKHGASVIRIRHRLEHPWGLAFVALWAFFPLVPTDAVCYVAGSIKMNFPRFIGAVLAGEIVLCSIYIFGGRGAFNTFM